MEPADLGAVVRHCRAQNRRDGTSYGVPLVFDEHGRFRRNIAFALVAVDEKGRVRAGYIFERTLEMMAFGGGREVTAAAGNDASNVFYELRSLGYQDLHVQVPKVHAGTVAGELEQRLGMARDDDRLAHFYREL
jgi:hypothetical protein